jgi:hypothetical protein
MSKLGDKIANRETEVQRAYDQAKKTLEMFEFKKQQLLESISNIDNEISKSKFLMDQCRKLCLEQGYNPATVLGI